MHGESIPGSSTTAAALPVSIRCCILTHPGGSRPALRAILAYAAIRGLIKAIQDLIARVDPKQRGICLITSARKSAEFALSREADPGGCDASFCGRTDRTGRADL